MSENLFIYHHLGLGDHFVCNGLVRYLLEKHRCQRLYLPTYNHNLQTVRDMYSDEPRITCLPVMSDSDVEHLPELQSTSRVIRVGFEQCRPDWDVSFYDSANVSFSARWNRFKANRNLEKEKKLEEFIKVNREKKFVLVHDHSSIGKHPINLNTDYRIIRIEKYTDSMMDWCGLIEKAEEVHCIDSSFIHLAQSVTVKRGIYHDTNRTGTSEIRFVLNDRWEHYAYPK